MLTAGMPTNSFLFPLGPDIELIELIHRGHDGLISFHRRIPDNPATLENLCSIPARALQGLFSQLAPDIGNDAYFSINGMYRGARWLNRRGYRDEFGCPLKGAERSTGSVRWLTCCFADLDCHEIGLDVYDALGQVMKAQDTGRLPVASLMGHSGRGLWLFWLLLGADYKSPHTHARAWPERCQLWAEIQRALGDGLAAVGSDAKARDIARITRVPGSINNKSGTPVGYWVRYDGQGKLPVYTLTGLAGHFGIATPRRLARTTPKTSFQTHRERGIKGARGRWLKARSAFERLWRMQGGFRPGTRNSAVWCYAIILKQMRLSDDELLTAIRRLVRDFAQPTGEHRYTEAEMLATLKAAKPGLIRNETMANMLDVTPDESAEIGWPPSQRFDIPSASINRRDIARRRRRLIRDNIDLIGNVPTSAALAELVEQAGLPRPSRKTVCCDLKDLLPNSS